MFLLLIFKIKLYKNIVIFILIYILIKQAVFWILKLFGVYIQNLLVDNIKQSRGVRKF